MAPRRGDCVYCSLDVNNMYSFHTIGDLPRCALEPGGMDLVIRINLPEQQNRTSFQKQYVQNQNQFSSEHKTFA